MFSTHMLRQSDGIEVLDYPFALFSSYDKRDAYKKNITMLVLDYISRLDALYLHKKVQ